MADKVTVGTPESRDFSKAEDGKNINGKAESAVTQYSSNAMQLQHVLRLATDSAAAALDELAKRKAAARQRMLSPGSLRKGAHDYTNRPYIQIVKGGLDNNKNTEQPIGEFSDFILHQVTESDLERTDVAETFGEPHIFTSGRFTRKITFAGSVRTTSANPASSSVDYRVPQHVLLRNFYERYLRSTAQAQYNYFTRIVVDGDIYEGYVINFNMSRDASLEMTMPFSLTMITLRRYHANDNDALAVLSKFKTSTRAFLPPSFAAAEMKDAVGDFTVRLSIGSGEPTTSVDYNTGKVTPDGTFKGVTQTMNIHCPYGGQTLKVEGTGSELWSLVYTEDGVDVAGTLSRPGKQSVALKLKNYSKVLDSATRNNEISVSNLTVKSSVDDGATVYITSVASDKPILKIAGFALEGSVATPDKQSFSVTIPKAYTQFTNLGDTQEFVFDLDVLLASDNAIQTSDVPLALDDAVTYVFSKAAPTRGGILTTSNLDRFVGTTLPDDISATLTSVTPGLLRISGVKYVMRAQNYSVTESPFLLSDAVSFTLDITVNFPRFQVTNATLKITLDFGNPSKSSNIFSSATGDRSHTAGRRWNIQPAGSSPAGAFIRCTKADEVANNTLAELQSTLLGTTLRLQYNGGALRANIGGAATQPLFVGGTSYQVRMTPVFRELDGVEGVLLRVDFEPSSDLSESSRRQLLDELANPVAGFLDFSSGLNLPPVQIRF